MKTRIVMSRGVYEREKEDDRFMRFICKSIARFYGGDYGELTEADREENENGCGRLFACYRHEAEKIWIIQEGKIVTVLFPGEW